MRSIRFKKEKTLRVLEWFSALPRRVGHEALNLLCPPRCPVCGREIVHGSEVLCQDCWRGLQQNLQGQACPVCGHQTGPYSLIEGRCHRCQKRRPVVSHVVRVGDYSKTLRQLILAFKFGRQSHLDVFLGSLLAAAMLGDAELTSVNLIVPIPLHWRRYWTRRYNQAELLARAAGREIKKQGRRIGLNCDLVRVRYTQPQTALAQSQRLVNLHGAFAVRRTPGYEGKHICLIDDVTTTGTTLRVAGQIVKKAGAARVSAAVLAVAAND